MEDDTARANLPCQRCGKPMNWFGLGEGSVLELGTSNLPCNHCGYVNTLSGRFTAKRIGGRLTVIMTELSPESLTAIRDSLRAVLGQPDATVETVAQAVEPAAPGLATWIRTVCNENQGVIGLIGLILAIVIPLIQGRSAPPTVNVTINQNITQIESGAVVDEAPIPRHAECICGSGKRYKNCHGRSLNTK